MQKQQLNYDKPTNNKPQPIPTNPIRAKMADSPENSDYTSIKADEKTGILFSFRDYLTLVDTTGRIQREGKRGFIPATLMPILERLNIQMDEWVEGALSFERIYRQRYRKRPQSNAA